MSRPNSHRLDELPLDRRIAGEARGLVDGTRIGAVYERRDIDPLSPHFKRRFGSVRTTAISPNLLGAAHNGDDGRIVVDRDFTAEIATNSKWTLFGTVSFRPHTSTANALTLLASFNDVRLYVWYNPRSGQSDRIQFQAYDSSFTQIAITPIVALSEESGDTWRFVFKRTATGVAINAWQAGSAPAGSDYTGTHTFGTAQKDLAFLGVSQFASRYAGATLNNVLLYDNDVFTDTAAYESFAANTSPEKTLTSPGTTTLLWHNTFADGGDLLTYTNAGAEVVDAYLIPKPPIVEPDNDTDIRFGGHGVIEIPFYLDFDEYFWTSTNQAARLEWCYQLQITLPEILQDSTVFEFQDLIHLLVTPNGPDYFLQAQYNNNTSSVFSTVPLVAGETYNVFIARDVTTNYLNVSQVL